MLLKVQGRPLSDVLFRRKRLKEDRDYVKKYARVSMVQTLLRRTVRRCMSLNLVLGVLIYLYSIVIHIDMHILNYSHYLNYSDQETLEESLRNNPAAAAGMLTNSLLQRTGLAPKPNPAAASVS